MASATPTPLLPHVDELVMEYLLFRGFTKSFQALNAERKRDRAKGFDVEQIVSQLLAFVQSYQIEAILDTWKFLEARFFSCLDGSYADTIRHLEDSWLRLYVVNAIKTGNREKATDFFKLLADKLNASVASNTGAADSWHRWFIVPYVKSPDSDPYFRRFFTKEWLETFVTSFRNFLSLIFRNLPLPKLLAFQIARLDEPTLKLCLKVTQSECSRLRLHNAQCTERIRRLEDAGHQLYEMVQTMVQHAFAEHFTSLDGWTGAVAEDSAAGSMNGPSSAALRVMTNLTEQLRDFQDIFGVPDSLATLPVTALDHNDHELEAALLDPLRVKVNHTGDSDATPVFSSPSSASMRSGTSASSPVKATDMMPAKLHPTLVEEVELPRQDAKTSHGGDTFLRYSTDAKLLVVARQGDREVRVFNVNESVVGTIKETIQTESGVINAEWVANSECLVFALEDGTVNVWNAATNTRAFIISYNGDERRPKLLACAASKAIGAFVLSEQFAESTGSPGSSRAQFFAIEDETLRMLSTVELHDELADATAIRWASDGSYLVVTHGGGDRVSILSASNPHPLCTWDVPGVFQAATIDFSADRQALLIATSTHITEWSVDAMIEAASKGETKPPPPIAIYRLPTPIDSESKVNHSAQQHPALSVQPTGRLFATTVKNIAVSVFTRGSPDPVAVIPLPTTNQVSSLEWHPDLNSAVLSAVTTHQKLLVWTLVPST